MNKPSSIHAASPASAPPAPHPADAPWRLIDIGSLILLCIGIAVMLYFCAIEPLDNPESAPHNHLRHE